MVTYFTFVCPKWFHILPSPFLTYLSMLIVENQLIKDVVDARMSGIAEDRPKWLHILPFLIWSPMDKKISFALSVLLFLPRQGT